METQELKFKTNLNCGGCVARVKADFDQAAGPENWQVDTDNADKVLTVNSTGMSAQQVISIVKSKGFQIDQIL